MVPLVNVRRVSVEPVLTVKIECVQKLYTTTQSGIYLFLDASKAFDKINHFKIFQKLLDRKTPKAVVRLLLFWYSKRTVCVN